MAELLYCNIYYRSKDGTLGVKYTEVPREVPEHCVYVQDAGCVQEAQRLLQEPPERVYLLQEGRRIARSEGLSVPPTLYLQGNIITDGVRAKRIIPSKTYWHSEMSIIDVAGEWCELPNPRGT